MRLTGTMAMCAGMPWHYIRCLLQLAQAHLDACPSDPTTALPPLLR